MARVRPSINDLDVFVDLNSDGTIAALVPNGGSFVKTNLPSHDAMTAGTGISGTGTVYNGVAVKAGGLIRTTIFIDLTGLNVGSTTGDIIGKNATANCHIGQVLAAVNGTILAGTMTCLEAPAGTNTTADIDLYSATESTGTEDALVTALTETVLINAGGAWSAGTVKQIDTVAAAQYLYLTAGATVTGGTYTAGKFLIELYGAA